MSRIALGLPETVELASGEGIRQALLADDPAVYFTTPHFNGYPAILVRLDRIDAEELDELIVEAWLRQAPKRLAKQYLESSAG